MSNIIKINEPTADANEQKLTETFAAKTVLRISHEIAETDPEFRIGTEADEDHSRRESIEIHFTDGTSLSIECEFGVPKTYLYD